MNKVYITSYSSVSSLGIGIEQSLINLSKEIQPIVFPGNNDKFNKPYFPISENLSADTDKIICSQFALKLIDLIEDRLNSFDSIPLFLSTSTGGIKETEDVYEGLYNKTINYPLFERHFFGRIIEDIKVKYKDKIIYPFTISTACSSSGHSIKQAFELIKSGVIDKAIVIGVDVLCYTTMIGFDSLKLVSEKGTKPLTKDRDGLTLGDGGGILLLESNPAIEPAAEILSAYSNVDGYHISSPDPEGTEQKKCILKAVELSGINIEEIDYINAHGTGTQINDQVEMNIIESLFNSKTVVTSLKSFIGHTLGASAIAEIALALGMFKKGRIYQVKGLSNVMNPEYIPAASIDKKVKYFLKNSFGFGGNNVSLVIKNLF